jgi:hypothetical protein
MAEALGQRKFVEKVCPQCKRIRLEEAFPPAPFNEHLDNIYTPFTSVEKEIRLLNILPGLENEPLRCSLQPDFLDNARYTALSYCWGAGSDRINITVNGRSIPVTRNLENALRQLRQTHQNMVVWADAICINQQDLAEKSVQVGMMGGTIQKVWVSRLKERTSVIGF